MALTQSRIVLHQLLEEKQKQFEGDNSILGISSLTYPAYIDSSRVIMDKRK